MNKKDMVVLAAGTVKAAKVLVTKGKVPSYETVGLKEHWRGEMQFHTNGRFKLSPKGPVGFGVFCKLPPFVYSNVPKIEGKIYILGTAVTYKEAQLLHTKKFKEKKGKLYIVPLKLIERNQGEDTMATAKKASAKKASAKKATAKAKTSTKSNGRKAMFPKGTPVKVLKKLDGDEKQAETWGIRAGTTRFQLRKIACDKNNKTIDDIRGACNEALGVPIGNKDLTFLMESGYIALG